ncbi:hypothetical protein RJ639_018641 [Escallonia herrerae]|uniref:S-acyltransferase n=1 Tax=Escallonia herrerae TaxID=1293975 RepID=A0AA88VBE4_9ASTE|nr:hypothetical protein RJ639_018641 [Escallonia herrerae]
MKSTRKRWEPISLSDPLEECADISEIGGVENKRDEVETNVIRKFKRFWANMWQKLLDKTKVLENLRSRYCFGGGEMERTSAYHVWPGNNVFFFRGRLICGPDPRGLLLTAVSIGLSSWIFAVYVANELPNHSGLVITISVILTIIVLVNLILVSMIDPGIVPRNDQPFVFDEIGSSDRTRKKRVININGVELKLKYCRVCKIYRPPRSCHCAVCDNCMENFDHHCPWIGQCIGLVHIAENPAPSCYIYSLPIIIALVFFAYIFAFSCWRVHQRMSQTGTGIFSMLRNRHEILALASFSSAAIAFLGGLTCYHAYLIAMNQTAYENFRQRYFGSRNPYDKGILNNIMEILIMRLPPSRVDFRAEVTPWWSGCSDGDGK